MFLTKFIGPSQKIGVKLIVQGLNRLFTAKKKVMSPYGVLTFSRKGYDTFFGYYDVSPFDGNGNIVYLEHKKDAPYVAIVLDSENGGDKKKLTDSYAWNWQQGCRLRWMPNMENVLSFNDFQDGRYFNRLYDVKTGKETRVDWPLYDIDRTGKFGLSLDFDRLGVKRPGYGYTCRGYKEEADLSGNGIPLIDIPKNTLMDRVTYREIATAMNLVNPDFSKYYIKHISFSPSGRKFLFFWIDEAEGYHQASLVVCDMDSKQLLPLETVEKVSHYDWLDDENILCTCYDRQYACRYYVYSTSGTKKQVCSQALNSDGHPSFLNLESFITDTYPDRMGYQSLYRVDMKNDSKDLIARLYSRPVLSGERRTDLHPRISPDQNSICVDSNCDGLRNLYIIKLK